MIEIDYSDLMTDEEYVEAKKMYCVLMQEFALTSFEIYRMLVQENVKNPQIRLIDEARNVYRRVHEEAKKGLR